MSMILKNTVLLMDTPNQNLKHLNQNKYFIKSFSQYYVIRKHNMENKNYELPDKHTSRKFPSNY